MENDFEQGYRERNKEIFRLLDELERKSIEEMKSPKYRGKNITFFVNGVKVKLVREIKTEIMKNR